MRFGNEHAVRLQHFQDCVDYGVHVLNMGEAIGRCNDACQPVALPDLASGLHAEIAFARWDFRCVCDVAHIGRLDSKNAMTSVLEIRKQRAVVRADIDNKSDSSAASMATDSRCR